MVKITGKYLPRVVDAQVTEHLQTFGAVCLEGPKWCGKTWTGQAHSASAYYVGDPANNFTNRKRAELDPAQVLSGDSPRLIDEWQDVPALWDATRMEVDKRGKSGQFLLTGSSTPTRRGVLHSGAGRIGRLRMTTMSLFERGISEGKVRLSEIFAGSGESISTHKYGLDEVVEMVLSGGWPAALDKSLKQAGLLASEYLESIIAGDFFNGDGPARNTDKVRRLLRSLARNESTTVSNNTLLRDMEKVDGATLDPNTVSDYLNQFNRVFLLDNQPPFTTQLRSSQRLKRQEKRHFADPSLAASLLGATPQLMLQDLETFGFLFESLCVHDIRIYASALGAKTFHYQDYKNREVDIALQLPDGSWAAIEVKLGENQVDAAAENLIDLRDSLAADNPRLAPKHLIIVCGMGDFAYRRADGIYVTPITALAP